MFDFLGNKYTYEDGSWWENREEGDTTDSDSFIGSPESLRLNVIKSSDAAFKDLKTVQVAKRDIKTGAVIKETQKYGAQDWDEGGTTNINIDTIAGDDTAVETTLNDQMPTGDANPLGYKWDTHGSMRNEVFLVGADGEKIGWDVIDPDQTLRKKYGGRLMEGFSGKLNLGLEKWGGNVLIRTKHKHLKDKRDNMNLLLDIMKRIKYTTTDGTATTLYDEFRPISSGGKTPQEYIDETE